MARSCVFCGVTGGLTDEHLVPQWVTRFIHDLGGGSGRMRVSQQFADSRREFRTHARSSSLKVKVVCAHCNNGWLSTLENDAQPHLETMIAGRGMTFSPDVSMKVATWALKMGVLLDHNHPGSKVVPAHHYRWLRARRRAWPTAKVYAGSFHKFGSEHIVGLQTFGPLPIRVYLANLVFGHMVLLGFTGPIAEEFNVQLPQPMGADTLVEIWPHSGVTTWPPPFALNDELLTELIQEMSVQWVPPRP